MSSFRSAYDEDVINAVMGTTAPESEDAGDKEPAPDPFETVPVREVSKDKGTMFSNLFWKPKTINDIPLPVFKDEDWHENAQIMIPDSDPNWVWNRPITEAFALAMYCGDTTLLFGLPGTGKSCLAKEWCAMFRIPLWRMSCNRETRETHFVGSVGVEYDEEGRIHVKQEPSLLTDSLRYGGVWLEDEAFRHSAALVLQSLREANNRTLILPDAPGRTAQDRVLKAPAGRWWYVMTDNTTGGGDETGIFDAEVQDASTLDRIGTAIEVPYLGKPEERRILQNHSNLPVELINPMLDLAKMVRSAFASQKMMTTMSIRPLLAWADKAELTGSMEEGLKLAWFNKLCQDDKAIVKDMYHQITNRVLK